LYGDLQLPLVPPLHVPIVAGRVLVRSVVQTSKATTRAGQITLEAQQAGLAYMFSKLNITTVEHKSSLDYIRMLQKNPYTKIDVGYSTKISTFTP
jgi:hypothetical protein